MKRYYLIVLRNLELFEELHKNDSSIALKDYIQRKRDEILRKLKNL